MGLKFIIIAVLATATQFSSTLAFGPGGGGGFQVDNQVWSQINALKEKARSADREGITSMYTVLKQELAKIANGSANQDNNQPIISPAVESATIEIYNVENDAFFNATILVEPSTSASVERARPQAYAALLQLVRSIDAGLELINTNNCCEVKNQVERFENRTINSGTEMFRAIYIPILIGRDPSSPVGAAITQAQRRTLSKSVEVSMNVFNGIKFVLARVCPNNLPFPGLEGATLESLENRTLAAISDLADSVFTAIRILFHANSRH